MKDLLLIFIEEEDSLLNLDNIIKLNEKVRNCKKNVKIVLVSNKSKIEIGTFIDIFNKLIGLDIIDFAISNSLNNIVYIEKVKDLKEHNIKNKSVSGFNSMVQSLVNIYSDYYSLNKIYYIANNDDLFNKLKMNEINYKKIDESLYNTIFDLKED